MKSHGQGPGYRRRSRHVAQHNERERKQRERRLEKSLYGGKPRIVNADLDGWQNLRIKVFRRDGGCIAAESRIFGRHVAPDPCRNGFGEPMAYDDWQQLEFDHVKQDRALGIKAPDDEAHGVTVCPWHHRLSRLWRSDSAEHREKIRYYLSSMYPEHWGLSQGREQAS